MSSPDRPKDFSWDMNMNDGSTVAVNRTTTTLYTFWGNLAMYNHVFVDFREDDDTTEERTGAYVFEGHDHYDALRDIVVTHGFPQVLNALWIDEDDRKAFEDVQIDALRQEMSDMFGEDGNDHLA